MSKIILDLKAIFSDTVFSGASGEAVSQILHRIEYTPPEDSNILSGKLFTATSTTTYDIGALSGSKGQTVELTNLRKLVVLAVKTEETVSGTLAIACPLFGISSGTITLTSDAQLDALNIGDAIRLYAGYSASGISNGSGADVTVTLGSPVGFKVLVLVAGDLAD